MKRRTLRYRLSPTRIVVMSVLSIGAYLFYWFYLTWKQYRDETGNQAYPIWHALALSVPVYGLYRAHAHMRLLQELMLGRSVAAVESAGRAVVAVLIVYVTNVALLPLAFVEITRGVATALLVLFAVLAAVTMWLLLHVQESLNRCWDGPSDTSVEDAKLGVGEVILAIIGTLGWLGVAAALVNPSMSVG